MLSTATARAFDRAQRALLADPNHGTPAYDRAIHAAYVRAYEARERESACRHYVDPDMGGPCDTCGVMPYHHRAYA